VVILAYQEQAVLVVVQAREALVEPVAQAAQLEQCMRAV
jgi:hypothetical protein